MQFDRRDVGRVTIIRPIEKRIDAAVAPDFKATIAAIIDEGGAAIVIDMGDVQFIDSSGLGALVACLKRVGQRGDLALSATNVAVSKVLTLTRMDKVFRIFATPDDAVAALDG